MQKVCQIGLDNNKAHHKVPYENKISIKSAIPRLSINRLIDEKTFQNSREGQKRFRFRTEMKVASLYTKFLSDRSPPSLFLSLPVFLSNDITSIRDFITIIITITFDITHTRHSTFSWHSTLAFDLSSQCTLPRLHTRPLCESLRIGATTDSRRKRKTPGRALSSFPLRKNIEKRVVKSYDLPNSTLTYLII